MKLKDVLIDMLNQRDYARRRGQCAQCGNFNIEFRDELSAREYEISALCQNCQDEVFEHADVPAAQ